MTFASVSLVKYNNPQLVSESKQSKSKTSSKKQLPPVINKSNINQTEDILNSILPPQDWEENNQLWVQYVSTTPATRLDVINLQERLDQLLVQRKAKETGLCPVREELYAQCFDELIRQVTVNCSERGLLLLRVRDEIRMTTRAYRTLYESSVAFGMRKALQAEQGKAELIERVKQLEKENKSLERKVKEQKAQMESIEKREVERRKADEKKYKEDIDFLKKQNSQYKNELERLMSLPKK
mmetsp:Transcript_6943/g.10157  ORF Transcript_6943/g.10157 Transcript_6943/m.10157 type:complete len:240 (+) Transcript_6943:30-749(+)